MVNSKIELEHRVKRNWTVEEDSFLIDNFKNKTIKQIGILLNRTYDNVKYRKDQLNIHKHIRVKKPSFIPPGTKFCLKCQDCRPIEIFQKSSRVDGLSDICTPCRRIKQMKILYGISKEEFDAMLLEQNNVCAICHEPETNTYNGKVRYLSIDHDHTNGKVRGLLCTHCNTLLGKAKDNKEILLNAIKYLSKE